MNIARVVLKQISITNFIILLNMLYIEFQMLLVLLWTKLYWLGRYYRENAGMFTVSCRTQFPT